MKEAGAYSTIPFFVFLLALAGVAYLTNSGKLQGILEKIVGVVEASTVLIAYALLVAMTFKNGSVNPSLVSSESDAVAASGLATLPLALLAPLCLSILLIVRLAIDVAIWLSPIPFVDLAFQTLKKVFTVAFLMLYAMSPWIATLVALCILALALLLFFWAVRFLDFLVVVLLGPLVSLFRRASPPHVDARARRFRLGGRAPVLAVPAYALSADGIPKRKRGLIVGTAAVSAFAFQSLFRKHVRPLASAGQTIEIGESLGWIEVRVIDAAARTVRRFAIPRTYRALYSAIQKALDARDVGATRTARLADLAREPESLPGA